MRIAISFDEGCSGNFLAALLTHSQISSFNRIDAAKNKLTYNIIPTFNFESQVLQDVLVTHENDISKIKEKFNADLVIRIHPHTGLFSAIYNVFTKRHLIEKPSEIMTKWDSDKNFSYDMTMQHLKDYFNKFTIERNYEDAIVFDFGDFYSKQKTIDFFTKHNLPLLNEDLIDNYQASQMPLLLDLPKCQSMESIVDIIPDDYLVSSPWFACYCIFCYEYNNNINESQRRWSIDTVPFLNKQELIKISKLYE